MTPEAPNPHAMRVIGPRERSAFSSWLRLVGESLGSIVRTTFRTRYWYGPHRTFVEGAQACPAFTALL